MLHLYFPLSLTEIPMTTSRVHTITALDFARLTPRPRLIDVREPSEFRGELGHVPGAELVPLGTLEAAAATWPREEPLVLVCRSGARSARAAAALVAMGFQHVTNFEGGTQGQHDAGLPVEGVDGAP